MATTKIWNIKGRLDSLINYAANPEKTDSNKFMETQLKALHDVMEYASDEYKTEKSLFVSGVNVTPDTAIYKMHQTKIRFGKTDGIIAFHTVQSFKPGEVTPEIAHSIGVKLAKEMWGDRFEILIATHLNKDHIHNHFVINSVSFIDGKKYYDNTANYNQMRTVSDKLCEEHNLSVIQNPKGKGLHYAEWKALKESKPTIRDLIRYEIDEIIKCSYTYKDFWKILKQRGYEVKHDVKYVALKPAYSQRYIRLKSLGENYSEETIQRRIAMARNGIKSLDKPVPNYNDWLKKYEHKKLKGFKALYYHYLYLFGKIRKKETPQRVSFYMREEIIKFERYKKQFQYICDNNIETFEQLQSQKISAQNEIDELVAIRMGMYGKTEKDKERIELTKKIKELRKNVRMCKNIGDDSNRISEMYKKALELEEESSRENGMKCKLYKIYERQL